MFSRVRFNSDDGDEQKNKRNLSAAMLSYYTKILGIIIHKLTFSPWPFANAIYKTTDIIIIIIYNILPLASHHPLNDSRFVVWCRDIVKRLNRRLYGL